MPKGRRPLAPLSIAEEELRRTVHVVWRWRSIAPQTCLDVQCGHYFKDIQMHCVIF
jgi:hypothetical protein